MTPKESIRRALILWEDYSKEYRSLLEDYETVKEELKRLGIKSRVITKDTIKDYPEIVFLRITEEREAKIYLAEITPSEMNRLITRIEDLPFNYSYTTIRSYVIDAEWKIKHHGRKKPFSGYGYRGGGMKRFVPRICLRYED